MISIPSFIFRKQKYFYKGGLVWDENSSDGRYVKENCKPLKVSFWFPPVQLMPHRAETGQATKDCPFPGSMGGCWVLVMGLLSNCSEGFLALALPNMVSMNVIGEHQKSQVSETVLLPAPFFSQF